MISGCMHRTMFVRCVDANLCIWSARTLRRRLHTFSTLKLLATKLNSPSTDRWTYATNKRFLMASRPRRTTYANASHVIAGRSVSCIARLARLWKYWWKIVLCHDSNRFRIYGLARERQSVDQISEGQRAKCFIKYSPHPVSIEIDIIRDELLSLWAQPMKV